MENLQLDANNSIWYTDGSKTNEGTGSGVYGPNTRISVILGKSSTIFQAELEAIRMCVEHLAERGPKGQRFAILSDSQAAIRALNFSLSNKLLAGKRMLDDDQKIYGPQQTSDLLGFRDTQG